jgi:hypothetical protein
MNAALKEARAAVWSYLNALADDTQDFLAFTRAYCRASEACAKAGLTLAQLRLELTKGGAR